MGSSEKNHCNPLQLKIYLIHLSYGIFITRIWRRKPSDCFLYRSFWTGFTICAIPEGAGDRRCDGRGVAGLRFRLGQIRNGLGGLGFACVKAFHIFGAFTWIPELPDVEGNPFKDQRFDGFFNGRLDRQLARLVVGHAAFGLEKFVKLDVAEDAALQSHRDDRLAGQ